MVEDRGLETELENVKWREQIGGKELELVT